ncbi:hypothetical protein [Thalassomonas sp. M1454]|uniref:hypothetical protein n=1 Tax=Thalassomonas sp. M1454 TaxID=2594477 RepID=UPI00117ED6F6|nr:hypothetical protein [Thalassomonas sp. M1454]TRX53461.1 hypothetical protein FNN08_14400 [Thalassomonas sp. M1454]
MLHLRFSFLIFCLFGCGPGAGDGAFQIKGEYYFLEAGGDEKLIVRRLDKELDIIVVDAKVVDFIMRDNLLYIKRLPRIVKIENGLALTSFTGSCELIIINTLRHGIEVIPEGNSNFLSC